MVGLRRFVSLVVLGIAAVITSSVVASADAMPTRFVGSTCADQPAPRIASKTELRPWRTHFDMTFTNTSASQVEWRMDIMSRRDYNRTIGAGRPVPGRWWKKPRRVWEIGHATLNPSSASKFATDVCNTVRKVAVLRVHDVATNTWPVVETDGVERRRRGGIIARVLDLGQFFVTPPDDGGGGGQSWPDGIAIVNKTGIAMNQLYAISNPSYAGGVNQTYTFNSVVPDQSAGVNVPPTGLTGLMGWRVDVNFTVDGVNQMVTIGANVGTMVDSNSRVVYITRDTTGFHVQ